MPSFPMTRRAASLGLGTLAVSALSAGASAAPAPGAADGAPRPDAMRGPAGAPKRLKIIGIEEHFATPENMREWMKVPLDDREPSHEALVSQGYDKYLYYLGDERFAIMDDMGVDMHVLSLSTPGFQSFPPETGTPLARESNDMVADLVRKHPTRYQGFGTLATGDPKAAARELDRCATQLGFNGVMINGRTRDRNMDDPAFLPIYEAAAARNFPIYIHPQSAVAPVRHAYYNGIQPVVDILFNISGLGWHYETGIQVLRMIMSGVFDRYPDLQVILGHWGEVVLFYLDRIDLMSGVASHFNHLKRPIPEYFKTNVHITPGGIYSQRYFRWTREVMGIDRIMFATDYPYQIIRDQGAQKFLNAADITEAERDAVAHGNWERLCAGIKR